MRSRPFNNVNEAIAALIKTSNELKLHSTVEIVVVVTIEAVTLDFNRAGQRYYKKN